MDFHKSNQMVSCASCDFDLDGDLDLIIGSLALNECYPLSDKTALVLKNISSPKKTELIDVTSEVFPMLTLVWF